MFKVSLHSWRHVGLLSGLSTAVHAGAASGKVVVVSHSMLVQLVHGNGGRADCGNTADSAALLLIA